MQSRAVSSVIKSAGRSIDSLNPDNNTGLQFSPESSDNLFASPVAKNIANKLDWFFVILAFF